MGAGVVADEQEAEVHGVPTDEAADVGEVGDDGRSTSMPEVLLLLLLVLAVYEDMVNVACGALAVGVITSVSAAITLAATEARAVVVAAVATGVVGVLPACGDVMLEVSVAVVILDGGVMLLALCVLGASAELLREQLPLLLPAPLPPALCSTTVVSALRLLLNTI